MKKILFTAIATCTFGYFTFAQQNQLNFDGVNDYVNIDPVRTELVNNQNYTIEFKIRTTSTANLSKTRVAIFAINPKNDPSPALDNKFMLVMGSAYSGGQNHGRLVLSDVTYSGGLMDSSVVIGDGNCHHIAITKNSSNYISVYVDGVRKFYYKTSMAILSTDRISLGQEYDYAVPTDFFNGDIDEFRIWNTVRSQSDINKYKNVTLNVESGLVCNFTMDQGISGGTNTSIQTLTSTVGTYTATLKNFAMSGTSSNLVTATCTEENHMLHYDPAREWVTLPSTLSTALSLIDNYTISFVIKPQMVPGGGSLLKINKGTYDYAYLKLFDNNSPNKGSIALGEKIFDGTSASYQTVSEVIGFGGITPGNCYNVALVKSGNTFSVFVNGQSIISTSAVSANVVVRQPIEFGAYIGEYYGGEMDDIMIWNYSKTGSELVNDSKNYFFGNEQGLLAYYNCNQGQLNVPYDNITQLTDASPLMYHANLNFALSGHYNNPQNWYPHDCSIQSGGITYYERLINTQETIELNNASTTSANINIFPNPFTGSIQIESGAKSTITISDLTGRNVWSGVVEGLKKLDLSDLPSGTYILVSSNDNGTTTAKRIVKQ